MPIEVARWLEGHGHGELESAHSVGGGCINQGTRLKTSAGRSFFLKVNPSAPHDVFACEAHGLKALRDAGGPTVPQVFLVGERFLLLEDLNPAPPRKEYWALFGRQLAALHRNVQKRFGFDEDNYIGSTPQPNAWDEDGWRFFAERRLLYQARLAHDRGCLSAQDLKCVARLATRLNELIPEQPGSLLHGDLWSGNAISDRHGGPAMIDPAAHYGWREAELGMTSLFGGFPEAFYAAYEQAWPLEPGWRERLRIYNLYHLLNHVNLFGGGYLSSVKAILARFD